MHTVLLTLFFIALGLAPTAALVWFLRRPARDPVDPPGIRSHVSFFGGERYLAPDEALDDQGCGEGVLARIAEGLKARGLQPSEVIAEDWGTMVQIGDGNEQLRVCCGYRGEDWLVFVTHRRTASLGARLRSVADSAFLRRLLEAIDATLKELPGIDRVSWHRIEDWSVGREDQGTPRPLEA
jgi:hypothetical protein